MRRWRNRIAAGLPRVLVVVHDLAMAWLAWAGLVHLRYSFVADTPALPWWSTELAIVVLAQGLVSWRAGLYRGLWRFASLPDLWNIVKASVLGLVVIAVGLFLYNRFELVPRSVLVLYPFVLVCLLGGPRFLYRMWKDSRVGTPGERPATRVLVLGAGRAGEGLVRDLARNPAYACVGLLDDNPALVGSKVYGVPVLGMLPALPEVARETAASLAVLCMPGASPAAIQRAVEYCEQAGLAFRTVPRLHDVLEGRVQPGELKELAIEDLLGRAAVAPDWVGMRAWLGGRRVLVTGGGGSIGSELCRQCLRLGVAELCVVEVNELALVRIVEALQAQAPALRVRAVLGDCGDEAVIRHAIAIARPDAIFHAAAYKQVPLLEGQLREAVRNNTLATATVARVARDAGVEALVLISTDKAVDPVNALGASKRMAELACQAVGEGARTRFITVRFGNVLDSAGSVVPLFRAQILAGGPVTVTHPEVTRYFMTIPEACQLILQAAAMQDGDGVYTLDMGEPVPIRTLAEQMIRLAGKQPGRDIAITYTGLRPGERLHEVLFHAGERQLPTRHPRILRAEPVPVEREAVLAMLERAAQAVRRYDERELAALVQAQRADDPAAGRPVAPDTIIPFPTSRTGKPPA